VDEDDDDEADIDPTDVPALSPLVDADTLRRREERKEEALLAALRREEQHRVSDLHPAQQ